jgi:hypothetical protein
MPQSVINAHTRIKLEHTHGDRYKGRRKTIGIGKIAIKQAYSLWKFQNFFNILFTPFIDF